MERITGIYEIRNILNFTSYIGSSVDIKQRWSVHKSELRKGNHKNQHLQRAWNKYGESNFSFSVLEVCKIDVMIEREQYYIDKEDSPYNILKKAYSFLGYKHTEETKKIISDYHKGNKHALGHKDTPEQKEARIKMLKSRKQTEETKKKVSDFQKGRVKSEEEKKKISKGLTGHRLSEETKKKLSIINKAKTISAETREKMRIGLLGNKSALGCKRSEETKKKMSEARKAYFKRIAMEKNTDAQAESAVKVYLER